MMGWKMKINVFGEEISLSIPATIEKFETESDEIEVDSSIHGTRAKLKIFFVGTTPDKRIFTKKFADKLVETLPGTPIVAYYDDESGDFIGHNDTQYVYGYVPIDSTPEFKFLDGQQWAVTDLILFTEREDNIGEVARKVIGKPQSLELNPDTVKYDVTFDSRGNMKEILFEEGSFYGLSVLADDQAPAFSGSGFLTATDFIEKFGNFINQIDNSGGNRMSFKNYSEFLSLASSEKIRLLDTAISRKYHSCGFIVEIGEGYVIYYDYSSIIPGSSGYFKINFTETRTETEKGIVVDYELGDAIKVYATYAEADLADNDNFTKEEDKDEKNKCAEDKDDDDKDDTPEEEVKEEEIEEEKEDKKDDFAAESVVEPTEENAEEFVESSKQSTDEPVVVEETESATNEGAFEVKETLNDEKGVSEENQSSFGIQNESDNAALNSEERAELEAFRLEKKERLISEYSELISKDSLESIKTKINEYSYNELEKELALLFAKEFKAGQANTIRSFIDIKSSDVDLGANSTQVLVDKYK